MECELEDEEKGVAVEMRNAIESGDGVIDGDDGGCASYPTPTDLSASKIRVIEAWMTSRCITM